MGDEFNEITPIDIFSRNCYNRLNWICDMEDTVWKVVNWVDEKGIWFESGTTAITVFDERKHICHWGFALRRLAFKVEISTTS